MAAEHGLASKIGHHIVVHNINIDTVISTWVIMIFLTILAFIVNRSLQEVPKGMSIQSFFEVIIEFFNDLSEGMLGKLGYRYVPFIATFFIFILISNWSGLIPEFSHYLIPPTSDINTTLGFALVSFFAFNIIGISHKGFVHWLIHFVEPAPSIAKSIEGPIKFILGPFMFVLFLVINIIDELARVLSLSVRLFGNITGEHITGMILIYLVIKFGIFIGTFFDILPLFVAMLGILAGAIQALIFAVLSLSYIMSAIKGH